MKKGKVMILLAVAIIVIGGVLFFVGKKPQTASADSDITVSDVSDVEIEQNMEVEQATPEPTELPEATPEATATPTVEPTATPEVLTVEDDTPIGTVLTEEEEETTEDETDVAKASASEKPVEKPAETVKPTEKPKSDPVVDAYVDAKNKELLDKIAAMGGANTGTNSTGNYDYQGGGTAGATFE